MLAVPRKKVSDLLIRCVLGWLASTGIFVSISLLPFSLAMVLSFTQPVAAAFINYSIGGESL